MTLPWRRRASVCPECRARAEAPPPALVAVSLDQLREMVDRSWYLLGLPDDWIGQATSTDLRALDGAVWLETARRDGAWGMVERGGWPE